MVEATGEKFVAPARLGKREIRGGQAFAAAKFSCAPKLADIRFAARFVCQGKCWAPVKLAEVRSALDRLALVRLAELKKVVVRFWPEKFHPLRSSAIRLIFARLCCLIAGSGIKLGGAWKAGGGGEIRSNHGCTREVGRGQRALVNMC